MKRPGDKNVRCTILLLLDYQPHQFKLDPRLARLLGVHTQTRPVIITALWQYIKTHKLQDAHEREYINCDKYLEQVSVLIVRKGIVKGSFYVCFVWEHEPSVRVNECVSMRMNESESNAFLFFLHLLSLTPKSHTILTIWYRNAQNNNLKFTPRKLENITIISWLPVEYWYKLSMYSLEHD